jgi:hypothetical protein
MAQPISRLRTLRPELATFSQLDVEMNRRGYVGTRILPGFNVSVASATFAVIRLNSLLATANADTRRTVTGGYNRGDYEFEERSYQTRENGWEEPIDEREKNMYSNFFDLEEVATNRAWDHVLASLETRILARALGAIVTAGQTTAAGTAWTNLAASLPVDNVEAAREAIWLRTGIWPNAMTISRRTFRLLRRNAQVISLLNAQGAGVSAEQRNVTVEMLKDVFDLEDIIVADAIRNTANQAAAAQIASAFPENQALITRVASTQDFKEPCLGRTFHWGGDGSQMGGEGGSLIGVVERYEEPQTRKEIVRVRHETDEFLLYPEMAQVITGVR